MGYDVSIDGLETAKETIDQMIRDLRLSDDAWLVGTRVSYAVYLEFGTRHMDPKPFFLPAVIEARNSDLDNYIRRYSTQDAADLDDLGEYIEAVAKAIEQHIKVIISRKGLIETGTLRASITAVPKGRASEIPAEEDISASVKLGG